MRVLVKVKQTLEIVKGDIKTLKTNDPTCSQGDGGSLFSYANINGRSPKLSYKWEGPYTIIG